MTCQLCWMSAGVGWYVGTERKSYRFGPGPGKAPTGPCYPRRSESGATRQPASAHPSAGSTPGAAPRARGGRRAGARGAPRPRARPDRGHGSRRPRRRLRGPLPRRLGPLPAHRRPVPGRSDGTRPDGRADPIRTCTRCWRPGAPTPSPTARSISSRRSPTSSPTRTRTAARTPTPSRSTTSPSSSTTRPPPTSASCTRRRTTGRTRGATSASTARSGIVQARAPLVLAGKGFRPDGYVRRVGPYRRRRADRRLAARLPSRRRRHPPRRPGRHACSPRRSIRRRPAAPRRRCSCSTAPTPTCSTTWRARGEAPNVARLVEMGTAYELGAMAGPPDRHARQPHLGDDRSAPRATTASSTTRGSTAGPASRSSRTRTTPGRGRCSTSSPGSSRSTRVVRRTEPDTFTAVGQRTVRSRRRILDVRLLPSRRRPAHAEIAGRASPTPPSASSAPTRTTAGRRSSTTWAPTRPSGSGTASTGASVSRIHASCSATSR